MKEKRIQLRTLLSAMPLSIWFKEGILRGIVRSFYHISFIIIDILYIFFAICFILKLFISNLHIAN